MQTIVQRMVGACHQVTAHQWVALLLARLAIGFFFVMSGYNKLFVQGIGHLRDEFIVYGIPWPLLSAWIDALVQFMGGFALMVGLGTRLWSLLVGFAMLVASVVVTMPDVLQKRPPSGRAWSAVLGVVLLPAGTHLYHGLPLVDLYRPGQGQS